MTDRSPSNPSGADPQKRRRLLETAAGEFARVGFDRASVDTIAERAGVAKGTVYLYFRSKDALFRAVLAELRRRLADQPVLDSGEPAEGLRRLVRQQLALADAAPDLFRCYTSALFGVNREFQAVALEIFEWQQGELRRLLERTGGAADEGLGRRAALLAGSLLAVALVRGLWGTPTAATELEEALLVQGFAALGRPA